LLAHSLREGHPKTLRNDQDLIIYAWIISKYSGQDEFLMSLERQVKKWHAGHSHYKLPLSEKQMLHAERRFQAWCSCYVPGEDLELEGDGE
jgi:hypothetical protein